MLNSAQNLKPSVKLIKGSRSGIIRRNLLAWVLWNKFTPLLDTWHYGIRWSHRRLDRWTWQAIQNPCFGAKCIFNFDLLENKLESSLLKHMRHVLVLSWWWPSHLPQVYGITIQLWRRSSTVKPPVLHYALSARALKTDGKYRSIVPNPRTTRKYRPEASSRAVTPTFTQVNRTTRVFPLWQM